MVSKILYGLGFVVFISGWGMVSSYSSCEIGSPGVAVFTMMAGYVLVAAGYIFAPGNTRF